MNKFCNCLLITCLLGLNACSVDIPLQTAESQKTESLTITTKDIQDIFEQYNAQGGLVLYDLENDSYYTYNESRIDSSYIPASTFKIIHSLIALETGAIKDENEVIAWDGMIRNYFKWNQDQTMRTAIKYSTVWFYQNLAKRIGQEQMQHWVDTLSYGNQDLSNSEIDKFWLTGNLRISPRQQIDLLVRLYENDLPFSKENMKIVRKIIAQEQNTNYILRGKTGWGQLPEGDIGWYVGYLEAENNVYFFANNIDITTRKDRKARQKIVRELFKKIDLMK